MKSTQIVKTNAFSMIIAVLFFSCEQSHGEYTSNPTLDWAYNSVWKYDANKVIDSISSLSENLLSDEDKLLHYLVLEHAKDKLSPYKGNIPIDSTNLKIAKKFENKKNYHHSAYAYFLFGADIIANKSTPDFFALTHLLKSEEYALKEREIDYQLLGKIYSNIFLAYRSENMIDVANEYIDKEIYSYKKAANYLNVASAFQKKAQLVRYVKSPYQLEFAKQNIDSSLYYFNMADSDYMFYEFTKYSLLSTKYTYNRDTVNLLKLGKYKCDSLHYPYSARFLIYYYIKADKLDSAKYYLDISAHDTLTLSDSKGLTGYFIAEADYEFAKKNYKQSSILYRKLFSDRERENYLTGQSKTATLSRQYQLEQEKRKRLEAEKDRWKMYFYIIILSSMIMIMAILGTLSARRSKQKQKMHEEKENAQKELIKKLYEADKEKQEQLKNVLLSRIELTKLYNYERLKYKNQNLSLPQWALTYIDEGILEKDSTSSSLLTMTDYSYCNIITYLKAKYPNLTEKKLIVIALIVNDISANDISIWLNITQQSVYNQTNRICKILGVEKGIKLRTWLLQLYEQLLTSSHLLNS